MNYNWTTQDVNTTVSTMQNLGKSQYEAFAGLDVQQNCMNTYFSSNYLLNNNKLKLSLALYCPNSTMGLSGDGADFHEVERQFYVNGGDPRSTSSSGWAGMSRFFADHTTIISAPFVTNFNSGHGKASILTASNPAMRNGAISPFRMLCPHGHGSSIPTDKSSAAHTTLKTHTTAVLQSNSTVR